MDLDVIHYMYSDRPDLLDRTVVVATAEGIEIQELEQRVFDLSSDQFAHAITVTFKAKIQNSLSTKQMRNIVSNFLSMTPNLVKFVLVYDFDANSNFHYHGIIVCSDRVAKSLKTALDHFVGWTCIKGISDPFKWTEYVTKYLKEEKESDYSEILLGQHTKV